MVTKVILRKVQKTLVRLCVMADGLDKKAEMMQKQHFGMKNQQMSVSLSAF